MNLFRHLTFILWYFRRPPWDSGIVPPEVENFIRTHQPGRALDLGCGSGTSSLALASAGWQVTGVDFVPHAIEMAKHKAKSANASVDFLIADVAHLPRFLFTTLYDLVLDIGCFHGLPPSVKLTYLDQLPRLLVPGGTWLMYGFFKPPEFVKLRGAGGPGLLEADIERMQTRLTLVKRQNGIDKKARPSAWFWFEKH